MGLFGKPNIKKLQRKSDVEALIKILENNLQKKIDQFT